MVVTGTLKGNDVGTSGCKDEDIHTTFKFWIQGGETGDGKCKSFTDAFAGAKQTIVFTEAFTGHGYVLTKPFIIHPFKASWTKFPLMHHEV